MEKGLVLTVSSQTHYPALCNPDPIGLVGNRSLYPNLSISTVYITV